MRNYGNLNILKTFYFSAIPVLRGLLLIHIQSTHCGIQNQVCLLWFFLEKKILNVVKKWEKLFCWIGEKLKTFESNTTPPLFSVVDKACPLAKFCRIMREACLYKTQSSFGKKLETLGCSTDYPKYSSLFCSDQVHLSLISLIKSCRCPSVHMETECCMAIICLPVGKGWDWEWITGNTLITHTLHNWKWKKFKKLHWMWEIT